MSAPAPIALFVHNRPERAAATLDALRHCELAAQSELTIVCDGSKSSSEDKDVERVRSIARSADGFEQVDVIEYPEYQGRSRLLIEGVTQIVDSHEKIIVVEDDLLVSRYFLRFMNDGLAKYARDARVISVCGYTYAMHTRLPETFFLAGAHCWGWATWKRSWTLLCKDPAVLVNELVEDDLIFAFDGGGAEPLTQSLQDTVFDGEALWSLCWIASAILRGKFTLYPGRSLVINVDMSGSDSDVAPVFESALANRAINVGDAPAETNDAVLRELRGSLTEWRSGKNKKLRLYFLMMALLPRRFEKIIYSGIIRRKLRQNARLHGVSGYSPSTDVC